jgi:hypothetical protein
MVQCFPIHLDYFPVFLARNTMKQQEFDGRRTSKGLKYDDIRFDKVFQDENCSSEGLWSINFKLEGRVHTSDSELSYVSYIKYILYNGRITHVVSDIQTRAEGL